MAAQHKSRSQRKEYVKRFQTRYGMTRTEWRQLKKSDPVAADGLRKKAYSLFIKNNR